MNIILLSGGSGKRLWPLSNDARSKQFLKLLKDEQGNEESMLQRTYRQITATDRDAKVLVAASETQVPEIRRQLGKKVSVCVEPARKDTFPAIALAAAYMRDVLGMKETEPVVVCPVDPYVDDSYYEALMELEKCAREGKTELTLMGIRPAGPSEKYGYIIPEKESLVSAVKEFKEKPKKETAKKYLEQGALWNAGVFAFRLGWLFDKACGMLDFTTYQRLFDKYETLKPISFDYAVVEKETSVQVVRYQGEWRDIGTWNTLIEVMPDTVKGNTLLDETTEGTKVINELDVPVLVLGAKDLIIVASEEGILVSERERSECLKGYAEKINKDIDC